MSIVEIGAAAAVAAAPVGERAGVTALLRPHVAEIGVERCLRQILAAAIDRVEELRLGGAVAVGLRRFRAIVAVRLGLDLVALEQRVLLDLLLDDRP